MILEAARRVRDPGDDPGGPRRLDRVLAPSSDPLLRFQQIAFTPADGYVLSRVDGTLDRAGELIQVIPLRG